MYNLLKALAGTLALVATVLAKASTISSVEIQGASVYSDSDFDSVTTQFIGRDISLDVLKQLEEAVAARYLQDQLLVRALLPEQAFTNGNVVVQVIEAQLGEIRVDAADDLRFSESKLIAFYEAKLRDQFPVDTALIEQTLNAVDAVPGIANSIDLSASTVVDGTDIDIRLFNTGLTEGVFQVDNLGSPSTGRARAYLSTQSNSLLGQGEKLLLSHLETEGTKDTTVQTDWLLGLEGEVLKLGLQQTSYDDSVSNNLGPVSVTGKSNNSFARLLIRDLAVGPIKLTPELSFERKRSRDYIGGSLVGNKVVDASVLSVTSEIFSQPLQASFALTLSAKNGTVDLSRLPTALQNDEQTARRNGAFSSVKLDVIVTKSLSSVDALNVSATGQFANKNLDSTQTLSFSGSDGVRGYQAGSISGDEGWLVRAEYSRVFSTELSAFGFADAARVRTHHQPWAGWDTGSPGLKNHNSIFAAGIGVRWVPVEKLLISAQVARRIGNAPIGVVSPDAHQGWLTLTRTF